jgi:hypothetical protein
MDLNSYLITFNYDKSPPTYKETLTSISLWIDTIECTFLRAYILNLCFNSSYLTLGPEGSSLEG